MKIEELRVGNYVDYSGVFFKVEGYNHYQQRLHVNTMSAPLSAFNRIELDKKWLLDFAVQDLSEFYDDVEFVVDLGGIYIREEEGVFYLGLEHQDYSDIEIRYVHQLQNIYFALTGKELQLKGRRNV